jgi:hypothetical protein
MRQFLVTRGTLTAIALVALVAACDSPSSKLPAGPSSPTVASVIITGPDSIAPSQSAQFSAAVRLSDGTVKAPTSAANLRWRVSNPFAQVSPFGLVRATQARGEFTVTAELTVSGQLRSSTKEIIVVPEGTYRLVGAVREAEFPTASISGARLDVTPGGLFATADSNGQYRLYGVPPEATVRVTASGYQPHEQILQLTSHSTQNFLLSLAGPRLVLTGNYTLAVDVVNSCPGSSPLPAELRHRTYDAVLTQTGPEVSVLLTEPRFRLNAQGKGNRFTGRVTDSGATFQLDTYSYYYGGFYYGSQTLYPGVAERLPNGTILVVEGTAVTSGSAAGLSGQLTSGNISNWGPGFPAPGAHLGSCFGPLGFALTPR